MMLLGLRDKVSPKQKLSGKPSRNESGSFPIEKHLQTAIRIEHSTHRRWRSTKSYFDRETSGLQYTRT